MKLRGISKIKGTEGQRLTREKKGGRKGIDGGSKMSPSGNTLGLGSPPDSLGKWLNSELQ